jgi:hypothetical protein
MRDKDPGLFDQRPGENPKKRPLLSVSSKMAQPFWLSSVEDEVRHAARAWNSFQFLGN